MGLVGSCKPNNVLTTALLHRPTSWVCPVVTGCSVSLSQIFLSYDDYLEQLDLYMRREWTCALSKRKNLTFEEVCVRVCVHACVRACVHV